MLNTYLRYKIQHFGGKFLWVLVCFFFLQILSNIVMENFSFVIFITWFLLLVWGLLWQILLLL